MRDKKAEIEARYCVVNLIYRGKLEQAEIALEGFIEDGTLSPDHAGFYRFILSEAKRQSSEINTPNPAFPVNHGITK